ncbi:Carboxypeptidase [Mycena indigotica]|uniref:Carboxypeptidase n=1 Tax=Mycena indigotica TaxID=2126181 RepID=A0A8H6SJZ5_9AGAR|nr:Carboxypeptidase [Mycena indigotica]KAF7301018.1 Carboxypeptidase [Mycena indigotica]
MLSSLLLGLPLLAALAGVANGKQMTKAELHARQQAAAQRFQRAAPVSDAKTSGARVKNITFSNPKASQFFVDGKSIPEVDFDVGPSWSGLIPISAAANETRKLFFWFFPPGPEGSLDDLIFCVTGPMAVRGAARWRVSCRKTEQVLFFLWISTAGLIEHQPFQWGVGTAKPIPNVNSWTNLSSMIWIEQPVGTGFSQGTPNIRNEDDLAAQLVGFMGQFLEIFSELKGKKLWISGESFLVRRDVCSMEVKLFAPRLPAHRHTDIANFIYENPTLLDLNLQGIWIADPVLGWDVVQDQIPVVDFVHKYEHVFSFNQSFMAQLDAVAARCNYAGYMDKFVTFPPKGLLPLPGKSTSADRGCDVWDMVFDAAVTKNPAFNIYRIFDTARNPLGDFLNLPCIQFPVLWDVLGFPGSFEDVQLSPLYFDRADVKAAIHAPANVDWTECSNVRVFPRGDASAPSAFTVLPNVIEKSVRSVINHGLADFILIADGTRIVIQNMTWNGMQGFQTPIANDSFIVDGVGSLGTSHTERGLTFIEVELSGHMIPQFSPLAAFQSMAFLMGFRPSP